ncbi:universal stress protein [Nocardia sp. NPDC006630]|uniref:universal stress protein n=1 Tax=Nocardia sp. NPDC006630 TaxID=3157181 RepID=UPI0033B265B8
MDSKAPNTADGNRGGRTDRTPAVVVGIDDSRAALRAAEWAAAEATARQLPLRLVQVVPAIDRPAFRLGGARYRNAAGTLENARWVIQARQPVDAAANLLSIETSVVRGQPEQVLVEMSESAGLLVLGSSDIGFFQHMVLGSTALAVTRDAHCPVALVRPCTVDDGAVLAVVSDRHTAGPALLAAFRAAQDRGVDVIVARVWQGRPWSSSPEDWYTAAPVVPDAQILNCQRRFPDVPVSLVTMVGNAVAAIEQCSAAAQLVVVGHEADRDRPERLGRITHELVCHAPCPVLVIPDRAEAATALLRTATSAVPQ